MRVCWFAVLFVAACGDDSTGAGAASGETNGSDASAESAADASPDAGPAAPVPCDRIDAETVGLEATAVHTAELVEGGTLQHAAEGPSFDELPAFCRIGATIDPAIELEVWLPVDGYNERLLAIGNGGMAGTIGYGGMAAWIREGYAVTSTDTGHEVSNPFDASWALGHPELIEDFGHRAVHLTAVAAKAVAGAFYGQKPRYSYFSGCSKGGQQALMEAQRYPEDFDGIVAGNPAHDWTRFYAGGHLWYALATLADTDSYIPADKLPLIGEAVNATCDGLDGVEDGIIGDPRACDFDPTTLLCAAGQDAAGCLSEPQVRALEKIYAGSVEGSGEPVFPGLSPGGEAEGWAGWVTGSEPFAGLHFRAADDFFKFMVFDDPDWDFRTFDYDTDLQAALDKVGPALDADDPDLRAFRDRGGKLLHYHGWSDPDISPQSSIDYYESVVDFFGGEAEVTSWYRLFMVPGMGHCIGGPGPDSFDTLAPLRAWVEEDAAPERIVAEKRQDDATVLSRPLCPYPEVARWDGEGNTDEAESFECTSAREASP